MSRLKRIVKRLGISLALVIAVLLIINGAYSWYTGRQLARRLSQLRAAGEPVAFADLAPKPIPPEQDTAIQLLRLAPQLKAFENEYGEFLTKTPLGKSLNEQEERGEAPTPDQVDAIREILSHYAELPKSIDEASRCKGYTSQIDYTVADSQVIEQLMLTASGRRTPARFLQLKITELLAANQQDEAVEMGMAILRLARHYDKEPALVNGLMNIAVRQIGVNSLNIAIRTGTISPEVRQRLNHELTLHDDPMWIQHVMKTERVISLSAAGNLFSQAWWLPWMERGVKIDMLDYYQRLLPVKLPTGRRSYEIQSVNEGVSYSTPVSHALITGLTPAIEAAYDAFNRSTATFRCLRIVNEITAFAQNDGHEPAGYDDLDLPDAVKLDPFSGKPLKLKWTDEGWVVYTVFKNGTDDDGDFQDQADWGLGPRGYSAAR